MITLDQAQELHKTNSRTKRESIDVGSRRYHSASCCFFFIELRNGVAVDVYWNIGRVLVLNYDAGPNVRQS